MCSIGGRYSTCLRFMCVYYVRFKSRNVLQVNGIRQVRSPQRNQTQDLLNSRLLSQQLNVLLTQIAGSSCCNSLKVRRAAWIVGKQNTALFQLKTYRPKHMLHVASLLYTWHRFRLCSCSNFIDYIIMATPITDNSSKHPRLCLVKHIIMKQLICPSISRPFYVLSNNNCQPNDPTNSVYQF